MTPDLDLIQSIIPGRWRLIGTTAVRQLGFFGIDRIEVYRRADGSWCVDAMGVLYPRLATDPNLKTAISVASRVLLDHAELLRKEITP